MVQAKKPYFIGIDVGGTNIKFGLVDDNGQTLAYHSMRTEQDRGAEDACARMALAVEQLVQKAVAGRTEIVRAGLATPGRIATGKGMILRPGNSRGWWDFPIRARVSHPLVLPMMMAN